MKRGKDMFKKKINSCDGIYNDSLDVRFTKACDNHCAFCIERHGIDSLGKTDVRELIKKTVVSGKKNILILGGEPLLNIKDVLEYVKGIRSYVDNIYLTTSLPRSISQNFDSFLQIMDYIDGLNVSLQHYNSDINNDILNAGNRFNRIELLAKILHEDDIANKVRVSINLCKNYIDSREELMTCISMLENMNCKNIKINELQNVSKEIFVSFEEIMGMKMHSPYSYGCQSDVSNLFNTKMKIGVKRSCFLVQDDKNSNFHYRDILKVLYHKITKPEINTKVLYENGQLCDGWLNKERGNR